MSKGKTIELVKGNKSRFVSEFEYSLIKDDMNGWEVKREAPAVPKEVADRVDMAMGGANPLIVSDAGKVGMGTEPPTHVLNVAAHTTIKKTRKSTKK